MRGKRWLALAAAAALAGGAALAADPQDQIDYRQAGMKALGGHMASMAAVVRGKVEHTAHLKVHARALAETATLLLDLFPEGSDLGETNAKPEIWDNWDDFKAKAETLQRESAELARLAEAGDLTAFKQQFGKVGKACKGCHDDYRKEKKKP
ncbi:c-type cytochrome [Inmirania thermothiophila]|uniref:Cytochrome c556 n=1 Tax=Inmirania thermothiophila TaxID=1750597 RepID=A0A3N1Y8Q2_9GAMM|nr:cytochrome c [Inmirania thermothiophila]ROR35194.1 cytochrome c556 [Inmirania thermothiophila]